MRGLKHQYSVLKAVRTPEIDFRLLSGRSEEGEYLKILLTNLVS
jgi:hypothetical protein